mmetsp:Transcript_29272/g.53970  ORF Transcript_29272/g.53970 Transcript_29272/m.53970 type:complete len:164 (-) Transcript_29272:603-1094(-)
MESHLLLSRFLFFLHFRKYWECCFAVVYQAVHVRHGYSRHGHCMKKFFFDRHVFGATVGVRMAGEGCDFKSFMQCSDISIKSLAARSWCIVGKTCVCAFVCAFVVQCLPPIIRGALWCSSRALELESWLHAAVKIPLCVFIRDKYWTCYSLPFLVKEKPFWLQ